MGEVAIQTSVPRKSVQPIASSTTRRRGVASFVLMPAKKSEDAKSTTPRT